MWIFRFSLGVCSTELSNLVSFLEYLVSNGRQVLLEGIRLDGSATCRKLASFSFLLLPFFPSFLLPSSTQIIKGSSMRARYAGGGRRVQAPVRPTVGSAPAYDYDWPPLASSHFSICHQPDRHPLMHATSNAC